MMPLGLPKDGKLIVECPHNAVNICVCCLLVLALEHLINPQLNLSALRDALTALVEVGVAPLADVIALLAPCPWDHWFWDHFGHKVVWSSKDAAGCASGVGPPAPLV
jgi:hypothetical protein